MKYIPILFTLLLNVACNEDAPTNKTASLGAVNPNNCDVLYNGELPDEPIIDPDGPDGPKRKSPREHLLEIAYVQYDSPYEESPSIAISKADSHIYFHRRCNF